MGYSLEKGAYPALRERGVEPIRAFLRDRVPWLADRAHLLTGFAQTTLLSVGISRVERWHRPGLLLLGDAAHVISPVADQVKVEQRAAAARARGRGAAPPAFLKFLFAVPALRTRGARGNAYGPFPPQLDDSLLVS